MKIEINKSFFKKLPSRIIILLMYYFEVTIAPFISKYLFFIYWPFYVFFLKTNYRFLFNIADGVGDNIPVLDNFFRARTLKELNPKIKYIMIRRNNDFCRTIVKLYGNLFAFSSSSNIFYCLILPMLMRYRNITLDAGLSRCKWYLPDREHNSLPPRWQTNQYLVSKKETHQYWIDWYRRRSLTPNFFLLRSHIKEIKFNGSFDTTNKKIALIHIKTDIVNATACVTNPDTYLPAINYLLNNNFFIVFVGREKMPEIFKQYNIYNYANSNEANFQNDLSLFCLAKLAITAGSGISYLADCFNTPCLFLNSWHIFKPPFSESCIQIPTLIADTTGKLLDFVDQANLYHSLPDKYNEIFPKDKFMAINASSEEILTGLKELISSNEKLLPITNEQKLFNQLDPNGWLKYAKSRISQNFLMKHKGLLESSFLKIVN
ncbi:MAG: TIGR04372 family glycosyltransferase [bacterium]|nr:TIGR04372 family glycosyltransferase [bacterium]